MPSARALAFVLAVLATAAGCSWTRAVGLGPELGPNDPAKGDTAEVLYEKAQRLFAAQQWSDAADVFGKIWRDQPHHPLASDARFYEAESRYGQGKYDGAFELYKGYLKEHPLTPHAPLIQRRIFDVGKYTILVGREAFFDYASQGVEELDYLVSAFPHGDLADDALIFLADHEFEEREFDDAIAHLHDLIDSYPTSEWALEARRRLAKAYREKNRGSFYDADVLKRSRAQYLAYIDLVSADADRRREYASELASARAELNDVEEQLAVKGLEAARFYERSGNAEAARSELRNVVRDYPKSRAAAQARSELGIREAPAPQGTGNGRGGP
jgi:TolA-binding protein